MASQRVWTLWSPIFKPVTPSLSISSTAETCLKLRAPPRAGFQTSRTRRRPEVQQRYGTANQPPPQVIKNKSALPPKDESSQRALPKPEPSDRKTAPQPQQAQQKQQTQQTQQTQTKTQDQKPIGAAESPEETQKAPDTVINLGAPFQTGEQVPGKEEAVVQRPQSDSQTNAPTTLDMNKRASTNNALSQILKMEGPQSDAEKPPHLQAPPYVHHFDTYTLVNALQENNSFSEDQAVSIMKAVRIMLADNMQLAREGIVSKGDAEMATYLFRAACSELGTEIRNNRSATTDRMRSERADLQHRVDVLAQRIGADTGSLKDELKGMFDDRKMNVRMERRDIENKIQEVNYKITSRLNSEMRSEAEALRWVLVRRTALAIVLVATTALFILRLNSSSQKRREDGDSKGSGGGAGGEIVFNPGQGLATAGVGHAIASSAGVIPALESGGDPALVPMG